MAGSNTSRLRLERSARAVGRAKRARVAPVVASSSISHDDDDDFVEVPVPSLQRNSQEPPRQRPNNVLTTEERKRFPRASIRVQTSILAKALEDLTAQ